MATRCTSTAHILDDGIRHGRQRILKLFIWVAEMSFFYSCCICIASAESSGMFLTLCKIVIVIFYPGDGCVKSADNLWYFYYCALVQIAVKSTR